MSNKNLISNPCMITWKPGTKILLTGFRHSKNGIYNVSYGDQYELEEIDHTIELKSAKRLMKHLLPTNYLLTVVPNTNIKDIRANGFKIEDVKNIKSYFKAGNKSPTTKITEQYTIIKLQDEEELNFFKLIFADCIQCYRQVKDL